MKPSGIHEAREGHRIRSRDKHAGKELFPNRNLIIFEFAVQIYLQHPKIAGHR